MEAATSSSPVRDLAQDTDARLGTEVYDPRTILLHWLTAALVAGLWSIALVIPKLLPGQPHLKPAIESLHKYLANSLVILAALHALAALFHHFHLKDNVLRRMLGR